MRDSIHHPTIKSMLCMQHMLQHTMRCVFAGSCSWCHVAVSTTKPRNIVGFQVYDGARQEFVSCVFRLLKPGSVLFVCDTFRRPGVRLY